MRKRSTTAANMSFAAALICFGLSFSSLCYAQAPTQSQSSDQQSNQQQPQRRSNQQPGQPQQQQPSRDSLQRQRTGLEPADDQSPEEGMGEEGPSLSAERIIEILRQQPELLTKIKSVALVYLQNQGQIIQDSNLTDDRFFREIEENPDLRAYLTHELKNRGYLSESDLAELQKAAAEMEISPVPQLQRRPTQRPGVRVQPETAIVPEDQNRPEVTRQPNPYPTVPSLRDLYAQLPSSDANLKRFGADFFRGTSSFSTNLGTNASAMDLPAGPDYVLGPGDGLNIDVWGGVSQRITRTVDREGRVALPEAGAVMVAGLTLADAQQLIQRALASQFKDARVDVSLTRLRTVRVYVVGDVQRPGAYDISSLSTAMNALHAAGGPTARGSLRRVKHMRGDRLVREVDLYDLMLRGVRGDAAHLDAGDSILVPPVGSQVTVAGTVRRPAIYELKNEKDLADVLDLAGGVLVSATLRQIRVERIEAHQRRIMQSITLPENNDPASLKVALSSFTVQDGDRVIVSPILPYTDQTVYLQGHVFRPGKYPYHVGMKVSDLIRSYQDLLPEPADRGEVIRLLPPDFRPMTLEFKMGDVLSGDEPITLQPFDTIRVLGRYEADAPKVAIYGEVLRPGEYPLSEGMTAGELVRMAGGFKRSALTREADVASYVIQNGQRILTEHHTLDIGKAVARDQTADRLLQPSDTVTVHQLSGWQDIGAAVTLNGEAMFPGTYGIQEAERLSALIRRAGGFRSTAYPEGAVLERTQVRELAERSRNELIRRIEATALSANLASTTSGSEQAALIQAMSQQQQQVLVALRSQPATGRLVVNVSMDISHWQNTSSDIELRPGDVLSIPKRPTFVLVNGQVYNSAAITYLPGHNAGWYLKQAGGPTELANRKAIFVVRTNGSVVSAGGTWWKGSVLSASIYPGDTIVVPDKIAGGQGWKNMLQAAQLISSLAIAARVATSF
jgi:protein involved in polysaccharide export with SLBB domain